MPILAKVVLVQRFRMEEMSEDFPLLEAWVSCFLLCFESLWKCRSMFFDVCLDALGILTAVLSGCPVQRREDAQE